MLVVSEVSAQLLVSSLEVWSYFTGHFPGQAPATGVLRRFSGNRSIVLGGFEEIRLFTEENTSTRLPNLPTVFLCDQLSSIKLRYWSLFHQ